MPSFVRDGSGNWRTMKDIYVKDGSGNWRTVVGGFVKDGSGNWRKFHPSRAPTTVSTFNAHSSRSWRTVFNAWRTDNDYVYQGEYGGYGLNRGFFFYPASEIRSVLRADGGRTIDRVEIYLWRRNEGGVIAEQNIYAYTHTYGTQPSGQPNIFNGPQFVGALARGTGGWFDLPTQWGEWLRDDVRRGIAIYRSSGPYVILAGRSSNANRGRLRITHS